MTATATQVEEGYRVSRRWLWQDSAACRGESLALFFGDDLERETERDIREEKAKAICAGCEVKTRCGSHSLRYPEVFGTWGEMTESEREAIRRRKAQEARDADRDAAPPPPLPVAPVLKTCTKCDIKKPAAAFKAAVWSKDGLDTKCRDCVNAARRARRAAGKTTPQISCEHAEEASTHV